MEAQKQPATFMGISPKYNHETTGFPDLHGFNTLLMGPAGTGKTHSIGTLVDTGLDVFYLALEQGLESLVGYYTDNGRKIPMNLHWHMLEAPQASFQEMLDGAMKVNTLSFDVLSKMADPNRSKHNQFIQLLTTLNNFHDDRTGKDFGPVNGWKTDKCLVIDGLAGLNRAAMSLVVGGKPTKNMAEWGLAQDQLFKLLHMLCNNCTCHFVLLAHVEREVDQILGGIKLTIATLGKALAPQIPPLFSDVILTVKQGDKWTWDTANPMADVKVRNLPISASNSPTFATIVNKWKSRRG